MSMTAADRRTPGAGGTVQILLLNRDSNIYPPARTPESTAECLILEDQFLSGPKRVIVIRTSPQASEKFDFYPDIGSGLQKIKKNLLNLLFFALSANSCIMQKRRLHEY